jgi:hypothetical protein
LHWAPIRKELVYDFLRGIKSIDEMQIKAIVRGQKVKITREVISKMLLPCQGLDTEWLNPLQHGIPKMCKNLVDETIVPRKKGWSIVKMKGRYI